MFAGNNRTISGVQRFACLFVATILCACGGDTQYSNPYQAEQSEGLSGGAGNVEQAADGQAENASSSSAVNNNSAAPPNDTQLSNQSSVHTTTHTLKEPPFSGSIYVDSDIILRDDPTTYVSNRFVGQGVRVAYDRRSGWVRINAYLFQAQFSDGYTVEFQVNPEFGSVHAAKAEVDKYAPPIGRVPTGLRANVRTVTIHQGAEPYGGGNQNLLIHTEQTPVYESRDILEETFVHEAAHASLDGAHASADGWLAAQRADNAFITDYAAAHARREDVAESFLFYLAVRYRADRISQDLYDTIMATMPHRIAYFDQQAIDVYPVD